MCEDTPFTATCLQETGRSTRSFGELHTYGQSYHEGLSRRRRAVCRCILWPYKAGTIAGLDSQESGRSGRGRKGPHRRKVLRTSGEAGEPWSIGPVKYTTANTIACSHHCDVTLCDNNADNKREKNVATAACSEASRAFCTPKCPKFDDLTGKRHQTDVAAEIICLFGIPRDRQRQYLRERGGAH